MPATEHAALGGSSAHRWMECPGSVRLSEEVPDRPTSEYAIEGSAAHELAEKCLVSGKHPDSFVDGEIVVEDDGQEHVVPVTEEMARAVSVYTEHVEERLAEGHDTFFVEMRVSLDRLDPPAPMFGTADAVWWDDETRTLDMVDYKHGRGVVVEVEENPQLMYYALGAVLELGVKPDTLRTTIVQPRADHEDGPVRSWTFGWDELVAFKEKLMAAAEATTAPDAPVGPVGSHCRFCPAKAICPAQHDNALVVAQDSFEVMEEDGPPPPDTLTRDQHLQILQVGPILEDFIREVRQHVKERMERGEEFPEYKLVQKRARRYWKDEDEARAWMEEQGIDPDRKKTRSPYQAEQAAKELDDVEVPEEMWEKKSSGLKLVHESNPREAVTPALLAADAFAEEE